MESIYLVAPVAVPAYGRMISFLETAMARGAHRFVLLSMASIPARRLRTRTGFTSG